MRPAIANRMASVVACFAGIVTGSAYCAEPTLGAMRSIREAVGPSVTLQLLDASTGQPARDAAVRLIGDDGIRCIRAPCPTSTKIWNATTDPQGYLSIPTALIRPSTRVYASSLAGNLIDDADPGDHRTWVVELLPLPSTYATPPGPPRALKLIDADTGRGIGDRTANFEIRRAGQTLPLLVATTNELGYAFLPSDLPPGGLENIWVSVAGYRTTHVDFAGSRHRVSLSRQMRLPRVSTQ